MNSCSLRVQARSLSSPRFNTLKLPPEATPKPLSTFDLNLSVFIAYPCSDNINHLIAKSFGDAKSLAVSENIASPDTINELISRAYSSAACVSAELPADVQPAAADQMATG